MTYRHSHVAILQILHPLPKVLHDSLTHRHAQEHRRGSRRSQNERGDGLGERHGRSGTGRVEDHAVELRLGEAPEELDAAQPCSDELFIAHGVTSGNELLQAVLRGKRRGKTAPVHVWRQRKHGALLHHPVAIEVPQACAGRAQRQLFASVQAGEDVFDDSDLHEELEVSYKRWTQCEWLCSRCMVEPEQPSSRERRGQFQPTHYLEVAWRGTGRVGILLVG
mmetsp:Transcript_25371/g.51552  ORF Transcript_25371/g.51552 Transcript_25371/m.51552 type:complete len:222 (-) Transcript_25371:222-887(-)